MTTSPSASSSSKLASIGKVENDHGEHNSILFPGMTQHPLASEKRLTNDMAAGSTPSSLLSRIDAFLQKNASSSSQKDQSTKTKKNNTSSTNQNPIVMESRLRTKRKRPVVEVVAAEKAEALGDDDSGHNGEEEDADDTHLEPVADKSQLLDSSLAPIVDASDEVNECEDGCYENSTPVIEMTLNIGDLPSAEDQYNNPMWSLLLNQRSSSVAQGSEKEGTDEERNNVDGTLKQGDSSTESASKKRPKIVVMETAYTER